MCSVAFVLWGCELCKCELPSTDVLPGRQTVEAFPCGCFIFVRGFVDFMSSGAMIMLVSVLRSSLTKGVVPIPEPRLPRVIAFSPRKQFSKN